MRAYERLGEDDGASRQDPPVGVAVPSAGVDHVAASDVPLAEGAPVAPVASTDGIPTAVAMPVGAQPTGTHYGQQLHPSLHAVGYGVTPPGLPAFPVEARVPDLPDAIAAWNSLRTIMSLWMAFSIIMVIVAPFLIFLSLPFGVLGIVASSMHLFESCRGRGSIVGSVVTIKVLAAVVATMNLALAAIFLLIAISAAEGDVIGVFVILTFAYGGYGALSLHVFVRMQRIYKLINPVTSGLVTL